MPDSNDLKYWIGFSRIPGIGRVRLSLLKEKLGSLASVWTASKYDLLKSGLDEKIVSGFIRNRDKISLDGEMEALDKYHIKAIPFESPEYPSLLKEISDFPAVIFIRGELHQRDEISVAVVGTRRATGYGRQITEELVNSLAINNVTIVSGLAKGIDTAAHKAALEANGRTLAVFACGLDIVYPPENVKLAREIMEKGALISEYPLGTKPKAEHFPQRNRILSGLSRGVLVVESGETSGALITANFALQQNREVFAVPGSILSPMSKGPNRLIQEGAKLVTNHIDILEELNLSVAEHQFEMQAMNTANETESIIIKCISEGPVHIDQICRATGLTAAVLQSNLAVMEINGMIKHTGNLNYVLNKGIILRS
jgi:DNA processing protein